MPALRADEDALTQAIVTLASESGRYGYRRLTALLPSFGWRVGRDRVQRIWRREGRKIPKKHKPRAWLRLNDGELCWDLVAITIWEIGAAICSFKEWPMRIMTVATVLALVIASQPVSAKETAEAASQNPKMSASRSYSAEESATLSRAARTKAEAQERIWDLKKKIIAKGICTGC